MKGFRIIIIFSLFLFGCQNKSDNTNSLEKEVELKNREIELNKKELELKEKELLGEQSKNKIIKQNKNESLSDLYRRVKKSVFLIYTQNNNTISQGSAFTITNTGIAISNYHVFQNASKAIAINEDNDEFMITEILDYNKDDDYIIFRLDNVTDMPFVELSVNLPEIGENCFTVGNPNGLSQTLSTGIISSYRFNDKLIQTTSEITHGSSGGPLFNDKGQVIGITTSGMGEANLNFAINIQRLPLEKFIKRETNTTENQVINENQIKRVVSSYYKLISEEKWSVLLDLYNPMLKRFYDKFNVHDYEAVAAASAYKKKFGILESTFAVRWNTLKFNETIDGTKVEFIMDYKILRKDKNKASNFVLSIIMDIDKNNKISSIYENILTKK